MNWQTGYCTNVHAAQTLDQTMANLRRHAVAVREACCPTQPMGVGLWLASSAAREVLQARRLEEFSQFLGEHQLIPYTLNGFPFGDFHSDIVRHDVYLPTWWEPERLEYTRQLIEILDYLLPAGVEGSISTLPFAWNDPPPSAAQLQGAADQLMQAARTLADLEERSGRLIYLCIEPEPGCVVQRSRDIIEFFARYLDPLDAALARRYLRVCHDVCHAAVMYEPQREVLESYRHAGLLVGKIQVSSAVILPLAEISADERRAALADMSRFAENRYLHQTVVRMESGEQRFFEDLPQALTWAKEGSPGEEWRVHFHVPIYLPSFLRLRTSQQDILDCLSVARTLPELRHLEVETYAWTVLPAELQQARLADGIAAEMRWLRDQIASADSR